MINEEQIRQNGEFFVEESSYFNKIFEHAEIISHDLNDKCCGFVFFYCNDPNKASSFISLVMVSPEFRNTGIARALVGYALILSSQRGFRSCRLEVKENNTAALKLYKSIGFVPIEKSSNKYLLEFSTA